MHDRHLHKEHIIEEMNCSIASSVLFRNVVRLIYVLYCWNSEGYGMDDGILGEIVLGISG